MLELLTSFGQEIDYAYDFYKTIIMGLAKEQIAHGLIYTAGLIWGIELIPQLVRTVKTKDVGGISLSFFFMCLVAYALYAVANAMLGNWAIMYAHIPSLVFNLIMVILIFKYKR